MILERIDALGPDPPWRDEEVFSCSSLGKPTGLESGAAAGETDFATSSGPREVPRKRAEAAESVRVAENEAFATEVCIVSAGCGLTAGSVAQPPAFAFHARPARTPRKGMQLESTAGEILSLPIRAVAVKRTRQSSNQSFEDEQATETTVATFKSLMKKTAITTIETQDTLWQINWCRVFEPSEPQVKVHDGPRLWFSDTVEDFSGSMSLYI
jgi:hypothetical protein